MPRIIFVDHQGVEREVDASLGVSVMEAAVSNAIPGIEADCGGACACATCHAYIEEAYKSVVGEKEAVEASMLEFAEGVSENSRLCCQISVTEKMDGMRVTTPEEQ